jgi:flagellar biosynthesis protein FlhF
MSATQSAKTFRGKSLSEALASVKTELGPQAVILSARQVTSQGLLGFGRPCLEVMAAPPAHRSSDNVGVGRNLAAEIKGLQDAISRMREDIRFSRMENQRQRDDTDQLTTQLQKEVQTTSVALRSVLAEAQLARSCGLPDAQVAVIRQLVDNGVEPGNAEAVVRAAQQDATEISIVRRAVATFLMEQIHTTPPLHSITGRRVAAFVGPTGVGKTTTIAKISAACVVAGRRVGLVTTDTYRIAAIEQLKCYADLMGIPLEVADSPDSVRKAIERMARCQVVLIDTAGRSPRATADINNLAACLSRAWVNEVHLVLSAGISPKDLRRTQAGFRCLGISRLLWTKLDECATFGSLFNGQLLVQAPLSYLSLGQRVPEDLEAATSERVTRLLLCTPTLAN